MNLIHEYRARRGSSRPDLALAVVVSAGGIGMALARRLGQSNRLMLVDRNADLLDEAVGLLADDGYDAKGFVCDITDPASVAALAAAVAASGPMRILAHVAGLSPNSDSWQSIMQVNLVGPALVAGALLEHASQGTAAVFVSSLAGHIPPEPEADVLALLDNPLEPGFLDRLAACHPAEITGLAAYLLSKRGLIRMCRAKVTDWARKGGRINSLSPGQIASPMGAFENQGQDGSVKYEMLKRMPLRREGTMLEIADAAEFLVSDRASYITGTDLLVDGGSFAKWAGHSTAKLG